MPIVLETNDYSAEYNAALLEDALSGTTLKTKTTLLVFAAVLLVISTLGFHVKEIPGLAVDVPAASQELAKGMLSLATAYLLLQFLLCFLQDYYRWRLKKARKTVEQFGKLLRHTSEAVDRVLETSQVANGKVVVAVSTEFEHLAKQLSHANAEVRTIEFSNKVLSPAQWLRFWVLDLAVPVLLGSTALCLSWRSAWFVATSVALAVVR